jgi:hypothetical protein
MNEYEVGVSGIRLVMGGVMMIGVVVGLMVGLVRWMGQRIMADIDARMGRIDGVMNEVARVDADLKRLVAELPMHYQRRDDAIREYTTINAKIDRLTEVLIDIRGVMRAKQD